MWATHEVWLLLGTALLLLLATAIVRDRHGENNGEALLLIASVVTHLVQPVLHAKGAPVVVAHAAMLLETALPCAFWLLAKAHFEDDFRLRPAHGAVLLALLAADGLPAMAPSLRYALWPLLPRLLALAIVTHALVAVHRGGQFDLVVARLRARNTAVLLTGTYLLVELLAELFLGRFVSPHTGENVHAITSFVLVFAICAMCLRMEPELLRSRKPASEPAPVLDPTLAERLTQLIEVDRVYLQEGLTIAAIAERLNVHEYKVRQLINAQLGFKNFNAFLHHYRLREARRLLADPGKAHLGVAQIAFDVGYRSLGPFNKAFKELFGQTPTEFRASAFEAAPDGPRIPAAEPS